MPKVLRFLNIEAGSIHQAAYVLAGFTLLSQILAFVRDRMLASIYGAGVELDIYYAAFRVPDFIFAIVASLVSVSVLIPFIVKDRQEVDHYMVNMLFTVFSLSMCVVSALAWIAMPQLVDILFPHWVDSADTVVSLSRILLLQPIFLGIANFFGSLAQARQRFMAYAIGPVLYNLGIVFGIIVLGDIGIYGVVAGVVIGALLHMLIQLPPMFAAHILPKLTLRWSWSALKSVLSVSLPRTLALSATSIALLFVTGLASSLGEGSITVFNFAYNIQSVPLALIGVSYSLAAFPTLSRYFKNGDMHDFMASIGTAMRHIIFWSLPISVLFIVLRAQIVRTILGGGAFDWTDTRLTAASVALFAISMVCQGIVLLLVRAFYASGSTRIPLIVNTLSAGLIVVFAYIGTMVYETTVFRDSIEILLRVQGLGDTTVLMIPLAFACASILNAIALWAIFEYNFRGLFQTVRVTLVQALVASIIMGYVTYHLLDVFDNFFSLESALGVFLQGFFAGILGLFVWAMVLIVIRNVEIRDSWKALHTRWGRASVTAEDSHLV